jgi:hypothetical protein
MSIDQKALRELKALKVVPMPWDFTRCQDASCSKAALCLRWCAAPVRHPEYGVNIIPEVNGADCQVFIPVEQRP